MDDKFFEYLIATGELDEFLGFKGETEDSEENSDEEEDEEEDED